MKWYILHLCMNLLNVQKSHVVELDFFQLFLLYSFRLIGPQTKQGYIHPWSVKIGLKLFRARIVLCVLLMFPEVGVQFAYLTANRMQGPVDEVNQ